MRGGYLGQGLERLVDMERNLERDEKRARGWGGGGSGGDKRGVCGFHRKASVLYAGRGSGLIISGKAGGKKNGHSSMAGRATGP